MTCIRTSMVPHGNSLCFHRLSSTAVREKRKGSTWAGVLVKIWDQTPFWFSVTKTELEKREWYGGWDQVKRTHFHISLSKSSYYSTIIGVGTNWAHDLLSLGASCFPWKHKTISLSLSLSWITSTNDTHLLGLPSVHHRHTHTTNLKVGREREREQKKGTRHPSTQSKILSPISKIPSPLTFHLLLYCMLSSNPPSAEQKTKISLPLGHWGLLILMWNKSLSFM